MEWMAGLVLVLAASRTASSAGDDIECRRLVDVDGDDSTCHCLVRVPVRSSSLFLFFTWAESLRPVDRTLGEQKTWTEAQLECESMAMRLVALETRAEEAAILEQWPLAGTDTTDRKGLRRFLPLTDWEAKQSPEIDLKWTETNKNSVLGS